MSVEPADPATSRPLGFSHVAIVTADLDRFRAFYEEAIGLETTVVFSGGAGHTRQAIVMAGDSMLHVFEVADYDPVTRNTSPAMFQRGRLDHMGFTVSDLAALTAIRDRLRALDASSGDIHQLGPMFSLRFVDPDGLESEINCFNSAFDPRAVRDADQVVDPDWLERARQVLHANSSRGPVNPETRANQEHT
ncbi:MAG: VOC family protein [Nakamurella sp.]